MLGDSAMDTATRGPAEQQADAQKPATALQKFINFILPSKEGIVYRDAPAGVLDDEEKHLKQYHRTADGKCGLALSGGGIRSAAFSCGVLESLAKARKLEEFSYLSTVSGGGYAGTALTWALHTNPNKGANDFADITVKRGTDDVPLIKLIRERANYLAPTARFTMLTSLINTIRVSVTSFFIYFVTMTIGMIAVVGIYRWLSHTFYYDYGLAVFAQDLGSKMPKMFEGPNKEPHTIVSLIQACAEDPAMVITALAGIGLVLLFLVAAMLVYLLFYIALPNFEVTYQSRLQNLRIFSAVSNASIFLLGFLMLPVIYGLVTRTRMCEASDAAPLLVPDEILNYVLSVGLPAVVGAFSYGLSSIQKLAPRARVSLIRIASAALFILLMWVVYITALSFITTMHPGTIVLSQWSRDEWTTFALCILVGLGVIYLFTRSNPNYISSHRFYRDRLMEAFLPMPSTNAKTWDTCSNLMNADRAPLSGMCKNDPAARREIDELAAKIQKKAEDGTGSPAELKELAGKLENMKYGGPYHIINSNIVLVSSFVARIFQRGGDSFILSPMFCGSNATGWMNTARYGFKGPRSMTSPLSLATAMTISAAAANPNTSGGDRDALTRRWAISFLMTLLNVRLGIWQQNPRISQNDRTPEPSFLHPGITSMFARYSDETLDFVELSDGGHFDNTGLYELFRRKLKLIVLADGSCDPDYSLDDLARALSLAYIDFDIKVSFGGLPATESLWLWRQLESRPDQPNPYRGKGYPEDMDGVRAKLLTDGFVVGHVEYKDGTSGCLVYMKPALIRDAPADVVSYGINKPDFPHETTANQFFTERQFESYRRLGSEIAAKAIPSMQPADGKETYGEKDQQKSRPLNAALEKPISVIVL
jgi:hypothetical protein